MKESEHVMNKIPTPIFAPLSTKMSKVKCRVSAKKRKVLKILAVGVGFEPTEPFGSPVFKTGSLNHSDTLPLYAK